MHTLLFSITLSVRGAVRKTKGNDQEEEVK